MFAKITLFIGVLILCCLAKTSAFAQSAYIYTDSWVDDSMAIPEDGQNGEVLVLGSGIVEFEGAHMADAEVRVTSPTGQFMSESGTWSQGGNGMAIVTFINAAAGPNTDLGNFETRVNVTLTCPYAPLVYRVTSLLITQSQTTNDIYYSFTESFSNAVLKSCIYDACPNTDQNPPNNCYISRFKEVRNLSDLCAAGIRARYARYEIPFVGFSFCYRQNHSDLGFNPCL